MAQPRDAKTPSWQDLSQAVLTETDNNRLIELLNAAEDAMLLRLRELGCSDRHHDERAQMRRAGEDILRIKTERLGWPAISLW